MKNNTLIPGLQPVVPAQDAPKQPSDISATRLQAISDSGETDLRFYEYKVDTLAVVDAFLAVQAALQLASNRGLNKELIGIENHEIAAVKTNYANTPAGYVDLGPQLVFISRDTGKLTTVLAYPNKVTNTPLVESHYATAITLIQNAFVVPPGSSRNQGQDENQESD